MRRHPGPLALGAWFDGEGDADVGAHVARCRRCARKADVLAGVRAAVRGEPAPPVADPLPPRPRWTPALAAASLVLAASAVAVGVSQGTFRGPLRTVADVFDAGDGDSRGAGRDGTLASPSTTTTSLPRDAKGQPRTGEAPGAAQLPGAPTTTAVATVDSEVLRLAVVVRRSGALSADADATVIAVRRAADEANRNGGAGGRRVEVVVVDASDEDAVAGLAGWATVAVGGFGAEPGLPWIFPADPYLRGSIAGELSPAAAGAALAEDLAAEAPAPRVVAIVGDGSDAALADGVAARTMLTRVPAPDDGSSCEEEIRSARRELPAAVALAVAPDVARRCLDAAARLGWRPPAGVLLAPSAAYAGLGSEPRAAGARTVLGFPWPTGDEPAAVRFREAVPGVRSYRAVVAYAAAQLALSAAQGPGGLDVDALARGTWRTDLVTLSAGRNTSAHVVVAGPEGWIDASLAANPRESSE